MEKKTDKQQLFQVRIDMDVFLRARARKRADMISWRKIITALLDAYAQRGLNAPKDSD